jgi:hypothetical protein
LSTQQVADMLGLTLEEVSLASSISYSNRLSTR